MSCLYNISNKIQLCNHEKVKKVLGQIIHCVNCFAQFSKEGSSHFACSVARSRLLKLSLQSTADHVYVAYKSLISDIQVMSLSLTAKNTKSTLGRNLQVTELSKSALASPIFNFLGSL